MRRLNGSRRRHQALRSAASFTAGAAVGSVASLLYAPTSGRILRRRLSSGARQIGRSLQRSAKRQFQQTQRALATQAGQAREAASGWIAGHLPQRANGRPAMRRRRAVRHAHAH